MKPRIVTSNFGAGSGTGILPVRFHCAGDRVVFNSPARCLCHCAAFTLIEMMISVALMSLILVSAYLCLGAGFSARKLIEPRAEVIQNARVAMAIMTADLRAACPLSTPRRPREGDFCQESLYLDKDPETGQFSLWRRRNPILALDPLSGGSKEEIATGVVGLKFEYFDGLDWYDSWGEDPSSGRKQTSGREQTNLNGLPEAVRITLLLDSDPDKKISDAATKEAKPVAPLAFQTVAQLNLADASQNASGSSDAGSSDNDSSSGQIPGNGGGNF
jgi:prepilin-type N-terminal cleavage/methylation domain-containing protein